MKNNWPKKPLTKYRIVNGTNRIHKERNVDVPIVMVQKILRGLFECETLLGNLKDGRINTEVKG